MTSIPSQTALAGPLQATQITAADTALVKTHLQAHLEDATE